MLCAHRFPVHRTVLFPCSFFHKSVLPGMFRLHSEECFRETEDFRLAVLPTEDFCVDGLAEVLDDVLRPVPGLPDDIEFSCRLSGCPAPGLPPGGRS